MGNASHEITHLAGNMIEVATSVNGRVADQKQSPAAPISRVFIRESHTVLQSVPCRASEALHRTSPAQPIPGEPYRGPPLRCDQISHPPDLRHESFRQSA